MASSNIARLGIVLGVDTAELEVKISKAKETFHGFTKQVERDSNNAAKDLVALRHATEDYGKTLTRVEQVEREIKAGRYQRAEGSLVEMLRKEAAAYDAKALAVKNATGAQFKMNEQQKINLTYQTTDFFTQIASGQSPFIAALQQGGQLKDTMGGVGNMFRAIGSLFTPFTVGLGTVSIALGSVGYAFWKAADEMGQFKDAMALTGGYSGLTYESMLKLGDTLSNKTNVAIGSARDVMQQLAASGKFTGQSLEAVGSVILRFSKLTGKDAKEASEALIPLLDGTASSAKQLNDKYHFLTIEQYKQIKALEKQGKLQESILMQAKLLDKSFGDNQRQLGYLETAWNEVGKAASAAWNAMMGWGRDDKNADLQKLNKEIALATAAVNAPGTRMKQVQDERQARLDSLVEQRSLLLKSIRMEEEAAAEKAKIAAKNAGAIREEDKYGPMGIAKSAELAKSKAEAEFAIAKQNKHELIQLDLEMKRQLAEANREMLEKNKAEDGRFNSQNLEIYKNKAIAIAIETSKKQNDIKTKYALLQFAEEQKIEDEKNLAFVARDKANEAIRTASQAQTREIEFQRESLELKYQMIYATQTEQKLAQISLEYARKRKEAESSPERDFLMGQLERQEAMAQMFVVMEESAKRTQMVFDSVFGNLTSAIDNFVKTGKLSMKDLARSIIQDLIAIQMRAATLTFLRGMFSSFGGTGSTYNASGGIAEHVFNPSAYTGKAAGGAVTNNTPYVVGERGPEVFVPSGSGTIIPNGQLGSMGGTTNVTNYNINAIDTKSFEDRIFGSSNAIWAANQYANKQLPSNGRRA
jgi:lambda family phage tail tape measure protein